MKLDSRRLESFIASPESARAVLLYGDDPGLMNDRARRITIAAAGSLNDPFSVREVDRASISSLRSEMSALSMNGARCVVRVRDGGDFVCDALTDALEGGGQGLIVIEAGSLPARSRLRVLTEASGECVAIGCYPPDVGTAARAVSKKLNAAGVAIPEDGLLWLTERIRDHATLAGETEKLITFAGSARALSAAEVEACGGVAGEHSLDEALYSGIAGLVEVGDRALSACIAQGVTAVMIVRGAMQHLQRLIEANRLCARGVSVSDAARSMKPAIFQGRMPLFSRALALWPPTRLEYRLIHLLAVERACKHTGAPSDLLARECLMRICHEARSRAHRARKA